MQQQTSAAVISVQFRFNTVATYTPKERYTE